MSIQSRIASDVYKLADRAVTPEQIKSVQAHLVNSVKDGSVPSYIGVPLIQDLNQKMTSIQNVGAQAQQMVNQPPIAQQVMSEAEQPGLATLPSNLPAQQMAGGGIVAFAGGDLVNDIDPDQEDYFDDNQQQTVEDEEDDALQGMLANMQLHQGALSPSEAGGINALQGSSESFSYKEPGQGEHGIRHEKVTESHGRGLDDLLALIKHKESRGHDYDKEGNPLTSRVGAKYGMQVMPETARSPGYGIAPAKSDSPEEFNRVGEQLYTKLLDKYQDPKLAAAAYNWGSGNVDKWLMAGADPSKLPAETREYIQGFKEGGIAHFWVGGPTASNFQDMSLDDLTRMAKMSEPGAAQELARRQASAGVGPARMAPSPSAAEMNLSNPSVVGGATAEEAGLPGLWNSIKSGISRLSPAAARTSWGVGLGAYSPELNQGEEAELQKRWANAGAGQGTSESVTQARRNPPAHMTTKSVTSPATTDTASGNPLVYMPDSQSYMGASDYFNTTAPSGNVSTQTTEPQKPTGIEALFDKYQQGLEKQHDVNAYLGLLSAGLGMMGGTSPYAFANIGQGAQKGVATYAGLEQQTGADERALLAAKSAQERNTILNDIRRQQMENQKSLGEANIEAKKIAASDREKKELDTQLAAMEAQAARTVDASGKIAAMQSMMKSPEEIANARQVEVNKILAGNKRYKQAWTSRYPNLDFDMGSQSDQKVYDYNPKTKTYQ